MPVFPFLSAAVGGFILMTAVGVQVLIALFSSIPLAKRRRRKCPDFDLKKANRRIFTIMLSGTALMLVVTGLMLWLAPTPSTSGYLFGLILALLRSIRRMTPTDRRNQTGFDRFFADCYPEKQEEEATRSFVQVYHLKHDENDPFRS